MKRILGLLGWLGVILVLAAVALRFTKPELIEWYQGLAMAGLVVTALYALSQWRDIARSFSGKNVKYGSVAISSVLLFLAILVAINYMSRRQGWNHRWDLTQNKQFSLSDQTRQILSELKQPVTIKAFHATGDQQSVLDRMQEYTYLSKQISVEYIDAVRSPVESQKYEITQVPTIVAEYNGRKERTSQLDEQNVSNLLKKLVVGQAKKVYFVTGHGEHAPKATDPSGYSGIGDALKNDNFEVDALPLAQAGKIPDDANVVIVAGPKTDPFPAEIEMFRAYLKKGGKMLIALDPPEKGTGPEPLGLIALAREWGINVGNDVVIDVSGVGRQINAGPSVPIAVPLPHPINKDFTLATAYELARSVTPIEGGANGKFAQKVVETSARSWAEADIKGLYVENPKIEPNFDKGDKQGPISLIAAASAPAETAAAATADANAPKPETRIVVAGDSDFASNRLNNIQGNRDIFLNICNWLAQQEDLIAIRPKDPSDRPLEMTADHYKMTVWAALLIIPGLLFANAVRVWWRKR